MDSIAFDKAKAELRPLRSFIDTPWYLVPMQEVQVTITLVPAAAIVGSQVAPGVAFITDNGRH
jgi:hypothetical protein